MTPNKCGIDVSNVPSDAEYKIVSDGEEKINTLNSEILDQLKNNVELVSIALTAIEPRYQHPHTGEITDKEGNISPRMRNVTIGTLIADVNKVQEIKENIRITLH